MKELFATTSACAAGASSCSDGAASSAAALVKRYFTQLTRGCGRKGCPNRNCFNCADGNGPLDPTAAAVLSLQLAQGQSHHLCDDGPPFLHIEMLRDLVSAGDKRLVKELAGVFSNSDALNQSFLLTDTEAYQAGEQLQVTPSELSGLDMAAVNSGYCELLRLRNAEVLHAVMNATEGLLCKLQVSQQSHPNFIAAGPALRQLVILMHNPLLLEPQYHKQVLLPLLSLVAELPKSCAALLERWWSHLAANQLQQLVVVVQQFLTVRLYHTQRIDDAVVAATRVLRLLFNANDHAIEAGRPGLPFHIFYNDAVNQEVNLKEDYRRWKGGGGDNFSFCEHSFVLEPASKSRVLMHDSTAQMTHEFEGAILRSLFVGATSPYLVIRVRRTHLISDTLLQMSLRKEDLKKPLKVQFVGEEGIDEGGVQKEFFQLIISQIFDVSYAMFTYDEELRTFWFNRASLESDREFELIGILLGVAIYNGVILDVRFPHVVYKKLMGKPVGLDDLKRAFPEVGRSMQQLLDWERGTVEETFGLSMQVCYEEYGMKVMHDLMPKGGEIAVTDENRVEYVRLYVQYMLTGSVQRQFDAFVRGFHSVCGGDCLQLFRWEELELLICGSPVLDFEALERVAQYDDGYSRDHPTILHLWQCVHCFSLEMQKKFLFFCTGSDRVPIKGLGNLTFVVSKNGSDEERLPSAHTCFNHLLLPEYKTLEQTTKQLCKAVNDTEGFHIV